MSHFEYISVAIALIYALAAGRLLSGLAPSLQQEKRYNLVTLWIFDLLLLCVLQWWLLWNWRVVEWTAPRFLFALSTPALLFLRAAILTGDPQVISSYRDYFFSNKNLFFAVNLLAALNLCLAPWVMGLVPWFEFNRVHAYAGFLASIFTAGIVFDQPRVQWLIAVLNLGWAVVAFVAIGPDAGVRAL